VVSVEPIEVYKVKEYVLIPIIRMNILFTERGEETSYIHTSRVVRLISFASGSFVPGSGLVVLVIPNWY